MRDLTNTLQSLTDDILDEVKYQESIEKTAGDYSPRGAIATELMTLASELRNSATKSAEVDYDDLSSFVTRMRGR